MLAQVHLFDSAVLSSLIREFRTAMRRLLFGLCDELEGLYREQTVALHLPVGYFRAVGKGLKPEAFSNWKAVGWVELLNDLVYFIDLREQLRHERRRREFAIELFEHCQEQWYEHSYTEELFPRGEPKPAGLASRLDVLCRRLARQAIQESLFLVPDLPCAWLKRTRKRAWLVPCDLAANLERAESTGCIPVGLEGASLVLPSVVRRQVSKTSSSGTSKASLLIRRDGISLDVGRSIHPLWMSGGDPRWRWTYGPPCDIRPGGPTLGPVLVYRKDLTPWRIIPPPPEIVQRLRAAIEIIEEAWPAGARNLAALTSRIIPLHARGVVSFSYRHLPSLSFINCFERDFLDLIDDLIHENSHHHLNLLLRKYRMRGKDRNLERFYSPWRRSLRPLHGILHATFTFTMGAILFERLSTWAAARPEAARARGVAAETVLRARFRCLEEVASLGYSLRDLDDAAKKLRWLTRDGVALVAELRRAVQRVRRRIAPYRTQVLRSRFGPALRRHVQTLERAGKTYRPTRP